MRCLVVQEGDRFTALTLDHVVVASGSSPDEAIHRLAYCLRVHAGFAKTKGHHDVSTFPAAGPEFLEMWERAQPLDVQESDRREEIVEYRVATAA